MTLSISRDVLLDTYVSVEQSLFPLLTKLRYYISKFKCTVFPSRHNILIFYYLHHLQSSFGFLILNSFSTLSLSNSLSPCLSVSLYFSHSLSITQSLSLSFSPSLFLSMSLPHSHSLSLTLSLLSLSPSKHLSL